ncbi:MAG: ribonuclease H-like domain-containing protein [Candidatus Aminicenantales bacterium]
MNFEDRLRRIRKERSSRTKTDSITSAWHELDRKSNLSTKEKLERLITLTRTSKKAKTHAAPAEPEKRKALEIFENQYHLRSRYGKIPIGAGLKINGEILSVLSRDRAFAELDLSTALFLDLETTGLSGGVGVVPFLVGLGYFRDDKFQVSQFFLGDLAEEEGLIQELGRFFRQMDFRSVVSFNGKAFDLPLLETRFILQRETLELSGLPHLDFLFSARSLWSHKHESCRLYHLAQEVLEAYREEDIPSAEIPNRYFEYLRTGEFSLIEPILYHNQEDLLSLLGVVIRGAALFSEERGEELDLPGDAMDLFGAARLLERTGERERSALYMSRALEGRLSGEYAVLAKMKLAGHFKKNREWEKALSLWNEMTSLHQLDCFRELAMYYEHREKDYKKAREVALEGLALSGGASRSLQEDFSRRLERLRQKIERQRKIKDAG